MSFGLPPDVTRNSYKFDILMLSLSLNKFPENLVTKSLIVLRSSETKLLGRKKEKKR